MIDALGKVYDSWFMTPNHTLMLVIDVGTWKSLIAVMIFLSGLYSSLSHFETSKTDVLLCKLKFIFVENYPIVRTQF